MSQPEIDVIQQAEDYIRAKQLPKAQRLLVEYIKQNPNSEQAWYTLSTAVDDPHKQVECLQRVLRINPGNTAAQSRLMNAMGKSAVVETPPAPAITPGKPAAAGSLPPIGIAAFSIEKSAIDSAATPDVVPPPEPPVANKPELMPITDTELSSLRSKMKFVKPRAPRRRGVRIVLLLLLVLIAALLGSYLMLRSLNPQPTVVEATSDSAAAAAAPTMTPAPTETPTITPTPSVTPTRYPPTWTPTALPTATPTRTATPLPTLDAAVEKDLVILQSQVSAVRQLPIEADVPAALLSRENFQSALTAIVNAPGVLPQLQDQSRVWATLGLVPSGTDLTRYTLNSFADNLGGFYLPKYKTLYIVGRKLGSVEKQAYAHAYARALVDQRYDVDQMGVLPICQIDSQRCQAQRAFLQGDAALATELRFKKYATDAEKKDLAAYQTPAVALPDDAAPLFLARDLNFVYDQGAKFVKALYQRGGWEAVDQALENLPGSTEQILHPEKYLAGEIPITMTAVPLTSTLGAPWKLIVSDALGEWRTYLLLSAGNDETARLSEETAQQAAAGWGGDHYEVYLNPQTAQTVLAAQWAWDTPEDAAEFKQAMSAYLDLRFRGVKADVPGQECWSAKGQVTCLYTSAEGSLLWLLGPDLPTIEQVRQSYPGF
jgi:hypothetical protein